MNPRSLLTAGVEVVGHYGHIFQRQGQTCASAECSDCDWERDAMEGHAISQKIGQEAREHALTTGHEVYYHQALGTFFNPKDES